MNKEEILVKVVDIIHDVMPETQKENLTLETVVNRDVGLDSMSFILVICKIEGAFDIQIPERKWMDLSTLGDVVDTVAERLQKK